MISQTSRKMLSSVFLNSTRLCHQNPLGPSRGKKIPPWAVEKLVNEGFTREEIQSNWQNLLDRRPSNFGSIEKFLMKLRNKKNHDISPEGFRARRAEKRHRMFREDQNYNSKLEEQIGPDLAAAKFLLWRSAAVKFESKDQWFVGEDDFIKLPATKHSAFVVEAVDLRGFQIILRGFEHLARCRNLKSIKMVNQKYVDDFCLDAVSGMFNLSLQYLDVSGCQLITEKGLSCLHRCKNLRLLNVYNLPNVKHPELLALLLEEALPYVEIRGISYLKPKEK